MIFLQHLIPQHLLSNLIFTLTRLKNKTLTRTAIRWFVNHYQVDLSIAKREHINDYHSFNDFFTRALKANARPLGKSICLSPVDGVVSQCGDISEKQLIQAKGKYYTLDALLTCADQAKYFINGKFATIYLSPKDYHRIHMPCDARLLSMTYIPGDLFSVNANTAQSVHNLFARNERLLCQFETEFGTLCLILVGAIFVGSMEVVWQGKITPPYGKKINSWHYHDNNITLNKGRKWDDLIWVQPLFYCLISKQVFLKISAKNNPYKWDKPLSSIVYPLTNSGKIIT